MFSILLAFLLASSPVKLVEEEVKEQEIQRYGNLAFLLIQDPVGTPCAVPLKEALYKAVRRRAIEYQIMNDYSVGLSSASDLPFCIDELRQDYRKLKNAPKVEEAIGRFPPYETITHTIQFNLKYRKYLMNRLANEPDRAKIIMEVIRETDDCYHIWGLMQTAAYDSAIVQQREALLELKTILQRCKNEDGTNYWETRQLYPCVPVWRFEEMK